MSLSKQLTQRQKIIERALERLMRPGAIRPESLREAMAYSVLSDGKRFRPLLCLGGCEAVGGVARTGLQAACALELIHTYSLVHDDLPAMDNADLRRGKPSCHRRFGEATAILVGDALLTLAFELLSRGRNMDALREVAVAGGTSGLVGGQVLDLECLAQSAGVETLEDVAKRKTAALIAASVVAGGLIAGASPSQAQRLRRYGAHLGLAFQLIDDAHDGDGLAAVLGREAAASKALRLIDQAKAALAPFGKAADTLQELADWLARTADRPCSVEDLQVCVKRNV